MRAKGTRRCFAETGLARTMNRQRKRTALGSLDAATGEAECATTQIVHCASSSGLEWWCAATPYADNSVSSRHTHAICFAIERMASKPMEPFVESIPKQERNATRYYLAGYVSAALSTKRFARVRDSRYRDAWLILFGTTDLSELYD